MDERIEEILNKWDGSDVLAPLPNNNEMLAIVARLREVEKAGAMLARECRNPVPDAVFRRQLADRLYEITKNAQNR